MNTEEVVKVVIDELRDRGLIRENQRSAYSSAELLLYNYPNLQKSIHENDLEIEELRKFGLPKKSGSCVSTEHIIDVYERQDYWKATEGNAKRALYGLLTFARLRPDGIWDGD